MTFNDRVDPEYREVLAGLGQIIPTDYKSMEVVSRRELLAGLAAAMAAAPSASAVSWEDWAVPGPVAERPLTVRIYQPPRRSESRPWLFYIHGGGMWLGDLDTEHARCLALSETLGAVLVSVEYRLAPENPHPAAVEDCYAALLWAKDHADELQLDPHNLAIYGGSAGGGLAIATAMTSRDQGGPTARLLMANYPMIDDRNETPSSQEFDDLGGLIWDRELNVEAWTWYLAGRDADQYAAPARADDLSGLPPTFIDVGSLDLFRDEDIAFAGRLLDAGIPTELHVYPGVFHGSEHIIPTAAISQVMNSTRTAALRRALSAHPAADDNHIEPAAALG